MKILNKTVLSDGTKIQIEDWSEDYSFKKYGATLATYPKSKINVDGQFSPKWNRTFRCAFEFESHDDAVAAYNELIAGNKVLSDYVNYLQDKKDAMCI